MEFLGYPVVGTYIDPLSCASQEAVRESSSESVNMRRCIYKESSVRINVALSNMVIVINNNISYNSIMLVVSVVVTVVLMVTVRAVNLPSDP